MEERMTRREWLTQNPPPRAAKSTQGLLDGLNAQNAKRAELAQLRQKWVTHRDYWSPRVTIPGEAGQAQQQVAEANAQIAEADKQLATTNDVPGRILQLQEELKKAARCPVHRTDLYRNLNRPEDMFTCEVGPHHLFWTRVNGAATLISLDSLNLPGLDYAMTDGIAITRAQWLASHPPLALICPSHPKESLDHLSEDRIDVFRCKDAKDQNMFLWGPGANGAPSAQRPGALAVWPAEKALPPLEEPI
jgi:hypothetical protein